MKKKKILLLSDDLRMFSGIATQSKEFVIGTLDKYEGDAILAFFGAPIYYKNHATQAIDTGVDLQKNLEKLRSRWNKNNKYTLKNLNDSSQQTLALQELIQKLN